MALSFDESRIVMAEAQQMYATNLSNGTKASEAEFRACWALAKELLCGNPEGRTPGIRGLRKKAA